MHWIGGVLKLAALAMPDPCASGSLCSLGVVGGACSLSSDEVLSP